MIKVLGRANSLNVRKVVWCLAELERAYQREDYGRGFTPLDTPEFRRLNPNSTVPVLIDGNLVLWESNAIVRHLCASDPARRCWPADAATQADAGQWMDWQATVFYPALQILFHAHRLAEPMDTPACTAAARHLVQITQVLDARVATRVAAPGMPLRPDDFALGPVVHRWFTLPIERPERPALARYYTALRARPAFAAHVDIGAP